MDRADVDYRLMSDYEVTLVNDNSKFLSIESSLVFMLRDGS